MKIGEGIKILIVDDEYIIRERLKLNVEKAGFNIVGEAGNGLQALEIYKKTMPHIIISDISMPAMSGIDLLEVIRETDPLVKFVFLTGYSEFDYAMSALKNNVSDYLLKPLDTVELIGVLEKMVLEIKSEKKLISMKKENEMIKEGSFIVHFFSSGDIHPDMNRDLASILLNPDGIKMLMIFGNVDLVNNDEDVYPIENNTYLIFSKKNSGRIKELCTVNSYAAMGISCHSERELKLSYLHLRRILLYRFFRPRIHVYNDEVYKNADKEKMQALELQKRKLLQENKIEEVCELIDLELSDLKTPANLEYYVYLIKGLVFRKSEKLKAAMINDHSPIWILEQFSSLSEFKVWLKSLIQITQVESSQNCELNLTARVKLFLNENYTSFINLDKIALNVFAHPNYISSKFKEEEGLSVTEYLCALRLEKAHELLGTTNLSCKKISQMVGFHDQLYFGKCFKKKFGMTPTASQKLVSKES